MQKCLTKLVPFLMTRINKRSIFYLNNLSLIKVNKFYFSTNPTPHENPTEEKMNIDYIESGIFEILKNSPKCKQDKLSRKASLEEIGFDSLDVVELVIAVEEKFNITISG